MIVGIDEQNYSSATETGYQDLQNEEIEVPIDFDCSIDTIYFTLF